MNTTAAIILAGGLGTRLRGVVADLPKPMAPVAGRPFLEYQLHYLKQQGIETVVLAIGHLGHVIQAHFGDEWLGMRILYSAEQEPLGTGGALRQAVRQLTRRPAFILNGDTFFPVSLAALEMAHEHRSALLSLSLKPMQDFDRYGTVQADETGRVLAFHEKRPCAEGNINGGVYLASSHIWTYQDLPEKFSFEKDILEAWVDEIPMYALPSDAYFIDIGIPEDYARAQTELPAICGF